MTLELPINRFGNAQKLVEVEKAEQAALESAQFARRHPWFVEEIRIQLGFYDRLGWIGVTFKDAFNKSAAVDNLDFKLDLTRAVLNTHHIEDGFLRRIVFGRLTLDNPDRLAIFGSLTHEGTHLANQFDRVAVTHATPYNPLAHVVLCPRDALVLNILKERQAFAMQLLMYDLLEQSSSDDYKVEDIPEAFVLQQKLQDYAYMHNNRTGWETETGFLNYYLNTCLSDYQGAVGSMNKRQVSFARLSLSDVRRLGECFGMNTFGESDEDLAAWMSVPLSEDQERLVQKLNKDLGIENEIGLPFFTDALKVFGTTPKQFLYASIGRPIPPSQTKPDANLPLPVPQTSTLEPVFS